MVGQRTCTGCGKAAPTTNGEHTLTTGHGWRVRRAQSPDGCSVLEWRCPTCWQKFKVANGEAATSLPPPASGRRS